MEQNERREGIDSFGASLLIGLSVLLGLNQALIKLVNVGFSPAFQVSLRSACAFLPVLAFAFFMRRKLSLTDGTLPFGLLNGLLFSIEFCLMFIALDYTTVARASLFFYVMPVWVAIAAHFLVPGEELTLNKTLGLGCAIAGVTWALAGDLGDADANAWIGDAFALLAGMFWAAIAIVTRISRLSQVSPEMNLLYQLAVSAVLMIAIAPLFGAPIREPTIAIYAFFAFQVIVIVAIGFLLWFWILSIYPISNMASFSLLAPGFGILFGWMIFDDPLTPSFFGAIFLIGAGLVITNRPPHNATKQGIDHGSSP